MTWKTEPARRLGLLLVLALLAYTSVGCRSDMQDQPRFEPFEKSSMFADGSSARTPVEGTVARGLLRSDEHFFNGTVKGKLATSLPMPLTRALLDRGQERFEIYCSPCHGSSAYGDGIVVQRGFPKPPSFHQARLRQEPLGHFFDVMSNGFGAMYSYRSRIEPKDRWAIAAYVRALQLSQNARISDVPAEKRPRLEEESR